MKKPNILIFMTDHQRADTVMPYNGAITPNVERLGREGIVFSKTYCPMAHCCPSRASFFTGLYPSRHGVWNNICNGQALSHGLKPGVRTFGEDLKEAGYNLAFSGKWHVSIEEGPGDRGWEELMVTSFKGTHHGRDWESIRKGAMEPEAAERGYGKMLRKGYGADTLFGNIPYGDKHDVEAVTKAEKAIEEFGTQDKPWAVFVGTFMPHAPYTAIQKYLDMYDLDSIEIPKTFYDDMKDKPNYYRKLKDMNFGQLTELEVKDAIRHFWAACTYLDDLFGRLLDALDRTGQAEDTLVLYCSDHGDYLGDHGLFHKGVPAFLSAYHVPSVVRWPNGIKNSGRTVDEFVSLADFAPTFTELAGHGPDKTLTGKSLVPYLIDEEPENWRDAMCTQCNGVENYFTQRMVFDKDFKYVHNGFDYDEFYDLRNDPDEMVNEINNPIYEDQIRRLAKKMWQFAYEENDPLATAGVYIMTSTAKWGPELAFRE